MIQINGERWRILIVAPSNPFLLTPEGKVAWGACDRRTHTIYLNNTLSLLDIKETLAHEITHAVMFSYGIDLSYDEEEIFAELMATYGERITDITDILFDRIK